MVSVVCVGVSVWDVVFRVAAPPVIDAKTYALDRTEVTGGIAPNGARTVVRLGGRAVLGSRLGEDLTAQSVLAELRGEGIVVDGVHFVPGGRTSYSAVIVDPSGDRTIVNDTDPRTLRGTEGVPLAAIDGADAVLADTRWADGALVAIERAARRGIPTVMDFDRAPDDGGAERILATATHVVFGRQGLASFIGTDDIAEGLKRVRPMARGWIGTTSSADGIYWLEGERLAHAPGFPVEAVDTLAAGDIWHAAFAVGLAEGMPEATAARFANATAALKCSRPGGGAGAPTRPEVEQLLRSAG
ncbi:MAG: PfkB family carbohydrate kinase [Geminicoccaceae bacterium]